MDYLNYKDDPRAVLCHFNKNHDPKTGQFTSGSGVSRYVRQRPKNRKLTRDDLTEEGKRRYDFEVMRNAQKKKDDRVKNEADLLDPHKWVRDDLSDMESALKSGSNLTSQLKGMMDKQESKRPSVRKKKLDLSNMTDQELNAQINRYVLEQRYQDTFNPKQPPEVSKGKKYIMNTLEVAGSVLAVGASAVTIAKAIHDLKKG